MKRGLWLILIHLILILFPIFLVAIWGPRSGNPFLYELSKSFALTGFLLLTLQPLLAARFKAIERPYGFDILIRFHRCMGIFALVLLVAHPLFLALAGGGFGLLISFRAPWNIVLAKIALLFLVANVLVSLYSLRLRIRFERWRLVHNLMAPAILIFGFVHSRWTGSDFHLAVLRWYWSIVFAAAMLVFVLHRFIRPWRLSRRPWRVSQVKKEVERVWTVTLTPPKGQGVFDYLPGQFQFITFHRGKDLPEEEHHWTISSSPTQRGQVTSTIKELGDFTATIGQTKPGDTATVQAPFGRFSHLFHPQSRDLVFIAGGIGITPLMSMLRYMRDTKADVSVLLIYANRSTGEITFREELEEMAAGAYPRLEVIHLLSQPEEGWPGERGWLDREKMERYCHSRFDERTFFLCGPPPMITATVKILQDLGVPDEQIETEVFSFLG